MESVMQTDKVCFICGRNGNGDRLEQHHIFNGANRKLSEQLGLKVYLCGDKCHRNGPLSVHKCYTSNKALKKLGQTKYEELYGSRAEFIGQFGKSYL